MLAMMAVSLTSCSSDDSPTGPITPQPTPTPVESIVGIAITTPALDFLEVNATHIDGNNKETPLTFAVADNNFADKAQLASIETRIEMEKLNCTASAIRGVSVGTTAKEAPSQINATFKLKDGYKFKEETIVEIEIYSYSTNPGTDSFRACKGICFYPDGNNDDAIKLINDFVKQAKR